MSEILVGTDQNPKTAAADMVTTQLAVNPGCRRKEEV